METVAEKPAFQRAFAVAALPAAGRRLLRVVPHRAADGKPASRSSSRSSSARGRRRAGDGRALRDLARPDQRRGRPRRGSAGPARCSPPTAEDDVGHIHDRMPLMVERERYAAWLDPARRRPGRRCSALLVPAAPGPARGVPGLHRRSTTCATTGPSWSSRCPLEDVPSSVRTPRWPERPSASVAARRTATAGCVTDRARATRSRRCCSATAPAAASTPATWWRWPRALPAAGHHRRPGRAAVAGRRAQGRHAAADARRVPGRRRSTQLRVADPAGRRRPSRRGPRRPAGRRAQLGAAGVPGAVVPAAPARPAGEVPAADELPAAAGADAGRPGRARRVRQARRSSRPTSSRRLVVPSPAPTTGFAGARRRPAARQADARVVEVDAGVGSCRWRPADAAGNR